MDWFQFFKFSVLRMQTLLRLDHEGLCFPFASSLLISLKPSALERNLKRPLSPASSFSRCFLRSIRLFACYKAASDMWRLLTLSCEWRAEWCKGFLKAQVHTKDSFIFKSLSLLPCVLPRDFLGRWLQADNSMAVLGQRLLFTGDHCWPLSSPH